MTSFLTEAQRAALDAALAERQQLGTCVEQLRAHAVSRHLFVIRRDSYALDPGLLGCTGSGCTTHQSQRSPVSKR